jgi:hypothetical protein
MDKQMKDFLDEAFFSLVVMAALRRSKTYQDGAKDSVKTDFRKALHKQLRDLAQQYSTGVDDDYHIKNIEHLADTLSKEFKPAHILVNDRFRIGSAQKALNLYLKYLWCAGQIPVPPPHCPFDNIIVSKLQGCGDIKWTTLDDIEKYKTLVQAAHAAAGTIPLAQWELETYNNTTDEDE